MSMLMSDVDGFNELDLDREYFSEFMAMAMPTLAKQHEEFVQECIKRLEIRLTIAEAILIEKQHSINSNIKDFPLTTDEVFWSKIRFQKLVYLIIDALLEDPSKKDLLLNEFLKSEDHTISYFDFYTLLHEKIQINQVPEWVFSTFESALDEENQARVGLVPLIKLFNSYCFDLGFDI